MKNNLLIIIILCLLVVSCEDYKTRYLIVYENGTIAVDDDYREEITEVKIEAVFRSVTVKKINEYGFSRCENLKRVSIKEGPSVIGDYAFNDCKRLTNISIPNSINSIGEYTFHNCRSLENIFYNGTKEDWEKITKGKDWKDPEITCTIFYSDSTYEDI